MPVLVAPDGRAKTRRSALGRELLRHGCVGVDPVAACELILCLKMYHPLPNLGQVVEKVRETHINLPCSTKIPARVIIIHPSQPRPPSHNQGMRRAGRSSNPTSAKVDCNLQGLLPGYLQVIEAPLGLVIQAISIVGSSFTCGMLMCSCKWQRGVKSELRASSVQRSMSSVGEGIQGTHNRMMEYTTKRSVAMVIYSVQMQTEMTKLSVM